MSRYDLPLAKLDFATLDGRALTESEVAQQLAKPTHVLWSRTMGPYMRAVLRENLVVVKLRPGEKLPPKNDQPSPKEKALATSDSAAIDASVVARRKAVTPDEVNAAIRLALGQPIKSDPSSQSLTLDDFASKQSFPVFIDSREIELAGIDRDTKLTLNVQANSLAEYLDAILSPHGLSWYALQTMIVISSKDAVMERGEVRVYRVPVRANDYSSVMNSFQQIEPTSRTSSGGTGAISALPPTQLFAGRQSAIVHRALSAETGVQLVPHNYSHDLDRVLVNISATKPDLVDLMTQLGRQIDRGVQVLPDVLDAGISSKSLDFELTGVSARDALEVILSQVEGMWIESGKNILVTTSKDASRQVKQLRVSLDFASPRDVQTPMHLIMSTVAPRSWQIAGGNGQIQHAAGRSFVVQQSQPAYRELVDLLADLKSATAR